MYIHTHKDSLTHSVITPINSLINNLCTQMLTYIHTVQVGGFLLSQREGTEYTQFRKVQEVLS